MKDKTLMRTALSISLIGIIALFILTNIVEVPEYKISEIDEGDVRVTAYVKSIRESKGTTFLNVFDSTGSIDVIFFDNKLDIKEGDKLEISGRVESYKGTQQIEAKKIILK